MTGRFAAALLAAALLGACSMPSWNGYKAQLQNLKGRDINAVLLERGPTTSTMDGADGHRFYVWEKKSEARTETRLVERVDPNTHEKMLVKEGGERIPLDCTTTIETDKNGIIVGANAKGLACIAIAPSELAVQESTATTTTTTPPPMAQPEPANASPTLTFEPAPAPVEASSARSRPRPMSEMNREASKRIR